MVTLSYSNQHEDKSRIYAYVTLEKVLLMQYMNWANKCLCPKKHVRNCIPRERGMVSKKRKHPKQMYKIHLCLLWSPIWQDVFGEENTAMRGCNTCHHTCNIKQKHSTWVADIISMYRTNQVYSPCRNFLMPPLGKMEKLFKRISQASLTNIIVCVCTCLCTVHKVCVYAYIESVELFNFHVRARCHDNCSW